MALLLIVKTTKCCAGTQGRSPESLGLQGFRALGLRFRLKFRCCRVWGLGSLGLGFREYIRFIEFGV